MDQNLRYDKVPRQLRYVFGLGLEQCDVQYLLSLKRKKDIAQRKWKID